MYFIFYGITYFLTFLLETIQWIYRNSQQDILQVRASVIQFNIFLNYILSQQKMVNHCILLLTFTIISTITQDLPSPNQQISDTYQDNINETQSQDTQSEKYFYIILKFHSSEMQLFYRYLIFIGLGIFHPAYKQFKLIYKVNKILWVAIGLIFICSKLIYSEQDHIQVISTLWSVVIISQLLNLGVIAFYYMKCMYVPVQNIALINFEHKKDIKDKSKFIEFIKSQQFNKKVDDVCSICLIGFNYKEMKENEAYCNQNGTPMVARTACNHYFHYHCISTWNKLGKMHCPLDNQQIFFLD